MTDHLIPLDILARQAQQIRLQVDTLRQQARKHYHRCRSIEQAHVELVTGHCNAIDLLLGAVLTSLQLSAERTTLTNQDRKEAAEAADRG